MEEEKVEIVKEEQTNNSNKQTYTAGLVLGIISIPCGLLIAVSGWILGIIGIVLNTQNKDKFKTTIGLVLSIVGLVLSVLNSILGIVLSLSK